MIALHELCWTNSDGYTEPIIEYSDVDNLPNKKNEDYEILDKLYNSSDKIIIIPGGQKGILVPIVSDKKQFIIMFPLKSNSQVPDIDIEIPYRIQGTEVQNTINMNSFIQTKRVDFDYEDKKKIFYRKFADTSIENMENVVCEYGTSFHNKFLDECVEYVFNAWTNPETEKSEMHDFYFKMLYYYDLLSLVIFAYTTKTKVFAEYSKYAIPVKSKDIKLKIINKYEKRKDELDDINPEDGSDLATSGIINLLKTSINRTSNVWIPAEFREEFDKILEKSYKLYSGRKKKRREINKVSAMLLPIGHYISKFPKLYHPLKGWTEDPTYIQSDQDYVENDVVIGYDERSKTGVHIRFKLRAPQQNIKKYKDSRLIEKGTVCKSKGKSYLKNLCKKLDITLPDKNSVDNICSLIRSKLIRNELKERIKKTKKKWFYFHYESNESKIE